MQKPFNSPMLIASLASVSASSPASGGVQNDYHRYGLETVEVRTISHQHHGSNQAEDKFQDIRSTLRFDKVLDNKEVFDLDGNEAYNFKRLSGGYATFVHQAESDQNNPNLLASI